MNFLDIMTEKDHAVHAYAGDWENEAMAKTTDLDKLRKHFRPGQAHRRRDLAGLSSNLDRHLKKLVDEGELRKLRRGLYYRPRNTRWGKLPPEEKEMLRKFLGTDRFVSYALSNLNGLCLGTTQLYTTQIVLNQKRHGSLLMGNWDFFFQRRTNVPKRLTKEILLVEMLNNMKKLAEDPYKLMDRIRTQLASDDQSKYRVSFDREQLLKAAKQFGTYSTWKKVKAFTEAANA